MSTRCSASQLAGRQTKGNAPQLRTMMHNLWHTSLDCHNVAQLLLHLRQGSSVSIADLRNVVNDVASFLKLTEPNIVARTETSAQVQYAFWNTVCPPLEFSRDQLPPDEKWLIACDFNFQCLAFNWDFSRDRHFTVKVVQQKNIHEHPVQQNITDVCEPSVVFSHDGFELVVPVFASGHHCIAIYDVLDDGNSLLHDRREIFWPEEFSRFGIDSQLPYMAFSPTNETLALASSGQVFFIDMIDGTFGNRSRAYDDLDVLALQYSPDGRFVVAAGNDLSSDDDTRFNGFIYVFNENGNNLWNLALGGTGERLPGIDTVAFSACSTKVACVAQETTDVYIVDTDSGHAHRLTMTRSVDAVVFFPSGQRLLTVHRSSICIIDSMSGAKLHETTFFDSSLKIEAMSWQDDFHTLQRSRSRRPGSVVQPAP